MVVGILLNMTKIILSRWVFTNYFNSHGKDGIFFKVSCPARFFFKLRTYGSRISTLLLLKPRPLRLKG